jgi:hypothetical protein
MGFVKKIHNGIFMEEELLIETSKQSVSLQTKKLVPLTKGDKSILRILHVQRAL